MKPSRTLAFASFLAVLVATPALADWLDVGQVSFESSRISHDSVGGPGQAVRALSFTAHGSDVFCRNVRVTFGNGNSADVFSGELRRGEPTRVDLPGDRRGIHRINFHCRAEHDYARVEIAANTGDRDWSDRDRHDRDDRSGPGWDRSGGVVRPDNWGRWHLLATERFVGRHDRDSSDAGPRDTRIETMALRPIDADARCRRVVVEFGNGNRRELDISRFDVMRRGLFYVMDVPGSGRTIERVGMTCSALSDRDVRVEIWAKRKP